MRRWLWLAPVLLAPLAARGAKISELTEENWRDQAVRFMTLADPSVQYAVVGSVFLGLCCGLLGSFIVMRKLSLFGDTLSHAVLPGLVLGFLWQGGKDVWVLFVGASLAGLAGVMLVSAVRGTTHLKSDTAMGLVLGGFYGLGVSLMRLVQNSGNAEQTGLQSYLFGQAAALGRTDVLLMGMVALLALAVVTLFFKEFLVSSFDAGFARSAGIAAPVFHAVLMLLFALTVVVAIKAVGVVLVTALLITPAATAYLLTNEIRRMTLLAAGLGIFAGVGGAFFSFLRAGLPTGPFMVLTATVLFVLALMLSPRHGILPRWVRQRRGRAMTQRENLLKAAYQVREQAGGGKGAVPLRLLARQREEPLFEVEREAERLERRGLGAVVRSSGLSGEDSLWLNEQGWQRARELVRNHRLWELYLTHAADYPADHVHEDAEKIEHVLGEELVRRLEERLQHPETDPHGRRIPHPQEAR